MFTLVLPFYRDTNRLGRSVETLKREGPGLGIREVLLCHNGSPEPWEEGQSWSEPGIVAIRYLHTPAPGIGAGYRLGLRHATQPHIILSASDLPFGFSDLRSYRARMNSGGVSNMLAIGSKFHPESRLEGYSSRRALLSFIFRAVRVLLFPHLRVRDTQGTLLAPAEVLRALASETREIGYLFSLELILEAYKQNRNIVELPVGYEFSPSASGIRIFRDGLRMAAGLLRLKLGW